MTKKLRIIILTQEDSFVIPDNIRLLYKVEAVEIAAVVRIDSGGALVNKKSLFIKGFGLFQVAKMGLVTAVNKVLDIFDGLFRFKIGLLKSLKSVAVTCDSDYKVMTDPNSADNVAWLKQLSPDLIVSFSAPCVFKNDILTMPRLGCINLHCSLLPKYPGLLPSFWTLYEQAAELGATVHMMDNKIDNGDILGQVKVPMPSNPSMFRVIRETKHAGGQLMVSIVMDILNDRVRVKANHLEPDAHFSWPTVDQIKSFRRNGGKLI